MRVEGVGFRFRFDHGAFYLGVPKNGPVSFGDCRDVLFGGREGLWGLVYVFLPCTNMNNNNDINCNNASTYIRNSSSNNSRRVFLRVGVSERRANSCWPSGFRAGLGASCSRNGFRVQGLGFGVCEIIGGP